MSSSPKKITIKRSNIEEIIRKGISQFRPKRFAQILQRVTKAQRRKLWANSRKKKNTTTLDTATKTFLIFIQFGHNLHPPQLKPTSQKRRNGEYESIMKSSPVNALRERPFFPHVFSRRPCFPIQNNNFQKLISRGCLFLNDNRILFVVFSGPRYRSSNNSSNGHYQQCAISLATLLAVNVDKLPVKSNLLCGGPYSLRFSRKRKITLENLNFRRALVKQAEPRRKDRIAALVTRKFRRLVINFGERALFKSLFYYDSIFGDRKLLDRGHDMKKYIFYAIINLCLKKHRKIIKKSNKTISNFI